MRGSFLIGLLFVLWSEINGQYFKLDYVISHEPIRLGHVDVEKNYLIKSDIQSIWKSHPRAQVLRSIDDDHHIVSGLTETSVPAWEVNDEWKLNLSQHTSSRFYILGSHQANVEMLKEFEILKAYPDLNMWLIKGSFDKVKRLLLEKPEIIQISNKVYTPEVESRVIDLNLNPNRVNKIHHFNPLLNGSSETVSIQENRFDALDIDLLNRSINSGLESEITDNHATEMATIIAGKGNSFITGRGVAKNLTITSSDFFDAMPDSDESYSSLGVITQNHSYGLPRENEYGMRARAFDLSAFNNDKLLHVFSSGNEGLEVSSDGRYAGLEGFANLTGDIKMAKNTLVVGSVDTVGNVPAFVSRGPAYDGRVKPEVVAYSVVGSSNSAALTSGVATLLQQQYRNNTNTDMPSALVKSLIINGADDVGPDGLDFLTGYGNVNAWNSLKMLENDQFFINSVSVNEIRTMNLILPTNAVNLKVTLVWTDVPGNVGDFSALVNDLDLRLDDGTAIVLPWVLNDDPTIAALSEPAMRGVDDVNNVEQVTISDPATNYTIEVEGTRVNGVQDFYVTWSYQLEDSFEWDFPTGSDNMPYNGETGSYFRWSTPMLGVGELSYSLDDVNWVLLEDQVDLTTGYWRWNNPPILNNGVKARMVVGSDSFETAYFSVSEPLDASVGFNCADSLLLRWERIPNAVEYKVSVLGEERLEEVATVTDTFYIEQNTNEFSDRRFSIQPILASGDSLLPTPTFDYALQGVDCYVFSFFQTLALDTGFYLNLTLGTTYGIEEIIFERNDLSSSFIPISTISNPDNDTFSVLDENPNQGFNEHRAIIRFQNGEQIELSAGSSFYLTEIPIRVFPNPIEAGETFGVITREFGDTPILELIDDRGAVIQRKRLPSSQSSISTIGLQPGIYYYRLVVEGGSFTGRILIR